MRRTTFPPHAGGAADEVVRRAWLRVGRHLRNRRSPDPSYAPSEGELVDGDVSERGREAASVETVLEAWDVVMRALASLTDREAAVFLRSLEGDSPAAIAEALRLSTAQVEADLERVVAVLEGPESV